MYEQEGRAHACVVTLSRILSATHSSHTTSSRRAKERSLDPFLHSTSRLALVVEPEEFAPVRPARLPRPEEFFEFDFGRRIDGVVRREKGALEEPCKEREVRRTNVLADRVEKIKRGQNVLR